VIVHTGKTVAVPSATTNASGIVRRSITILRKR
jgi:hypothetical protein